MKPHRICVFCGQAVRFWQNKAKVWKLKGGFDWAHDDCARMEEHAGRVEEIPR